MITSTGSAVGIGTTSPLTNTHIAGTNGVTDSFGQLLISTTNTATIDFGGQITLGGFFNGTTNQTAFGAIAGRKENATANNALGYLSFATQNGTINERMRITSAGNVGIGTASPSAALDIDKAEGTMMRVKRTGVAGEFQMYQGPNVVYLDSAAASGNLAFATVGTERMRITSGGWTKISNNATYVSTTSSTHEMNSNEANWICESHNRNASPFGLRIKYPNASPNGNDNWFLYADDSTTLRFGVKSNGNVVNTNNSYGPISDIKLKENIVDTTPKLEDLLKVRIVNYNLIADPDLKQIGVIAQELEQIFPGLVDEHQDIDREGNDLGTTTKSVKMSVFVPMLIKAMQEQNQIIQELNERLNKAGL
jgi:hypothetical protein